eukprot:1145151-Pelagomonas_calceolata.AAC.2
MPSMSTRYAPVDAPSLPKEWHDAGLFTCFQVGYSQLHKALHTAVLVVIPARVLAGIMHAEGNQYWPYMQRLAGTRHAEGHQSLTRAWSQTMCLPFKAKGRPLVQPHVDT